MKFVDTTQLSLECFTMQMPAHSTAEADANSNSDEATGKAVNEAGNSGCLKAQNHQPTKTSTVYSYVFRGD